MKTVVIKALIGLLACCAVLLIGMIASGRNIVYYTPSSSSYGQPVDASKNRTAILPFDDLMFDDGDYWEAYVIFGQSDFENLQEGIKNKGGRVLHTSSIPLLKELKQLEYKWEGEIGTPESDLVILRNGKITYVTSIFLDKGYVGLQGRRFGFVVPLNSSRFVSIFSQFDRVYSPLLVLENQ